MKIAIVSSWPPRQCGIASFASDMRLGLKQNGYSNLPVVAVSREPGEYHYGDEVVYEIIQDEAETYREAAQVLNDLAVDAVILQHEYGLFGGPDGDMILGLLSSLKVPVVSILHTVLSKPSAGQYKVLGRLAEYSSKVVVIAERAKNILGQVYGIPPQKTVHIPHGVPEPPLPKAVQKVKESFGGGGKTLLLTFGLLSPGKGLELAIKAVGEIRSSCPDLLYLIVGATHPNERRLHGEAYREGLQRMIRMMGLEENIRLIDRFLDEDELMAHIAACDIYVIPYPSREQISSGTLSFALGLGKPIISTPFIYAEEMLGDGSGLLVPFGDAGQMGKAMATLIKDRGFRAELAAKALVKGRKMQWKVVAQKYAKLAKTVGKIHPVHKGRIPPAVGERHSGKKDLVKLPAVSYDHLIRMTDDTGLLQHACGSIPNRQLGYTSDDNARGLLAMALAPKEQETQALKLAENYLAFLYYAWEGDGWFHNCFSYDRRPLEEKPSDDCQGRVLWALAATVRVWSELPLAKVAFRMFRESLPTWTRMTSIRGYAGVVMALATLLRSTPSLGTEGCSQDLSEGLVAEYTETLVKVADKLAAKYKATARKNWLWYENILTYDCGLMPAAMFQAYGVVPKKEYLKIAAESLHFLAGKTVEEGIFRPVGNRGWYPRNGKKAEYDQQPLEAWAMALAAISAYDVTRNRRWLDLADIAERWFLGQNDLGISLYDPRTGGCADGLHSEGINENQGAESTLAYILTRSLQEAVRESTLSEVQEA
ncbi:MAG: glycosyltransferase [Firmicutes bacterium]|nr:glycosyltransferase [Bacillota bacterium]